MAAAITDLITDTFNSANPNVAKVTAGRTAGALSLSCDNLAGWPTVAAVHFSTYKIDTTGAVVVGSQIDWKGLVAGNTIGTMTRKAGATDAGNAIGDIVEMNPTGSWGHDLYTGIRAHANQDGSLITAAVQTALAAATSTNEAGSTMQVIRNETQFDFIASGGVWSGLGYGTTLTATMTALVCYQAGQRVTVAAVATRTFTASKDTYIDVLNTAGVGSLVYTEVANNAASPALAASSIRLGIVVTGANIAAATSINQGQYNAIIPIVASRTLMDSDSNGIVIYPLVKRRPVTFSGNMSAITLTSANSTLALAILPTTPVAHKYSVVAVFEFNNSAGTSGDFSGSIYLGAVLQNANYWSAASGTYFNTVPVTAIVVASSGTISFQGAKTGTNQANTTRSNYTVIDLGVA